MWTTQSRRRDAGNMAVSQSGKAQAGPSIDRLAAGAAPSAEQMGRRVDLPEQIREKMESSFGADFSAVRLYESQTVADAGARAVTQGTNIAFAPGELELGTTAGQALLGHELSHVVSQSRGESAGRGFLNDSGLEAQADTQGMLAARGESVYSGPVTPVGASAAVSASGPMQAKKKSTEEAEEQANLERISLPSHLHPIERSRVKSGLLERRDDRIQRASWASGLQSQQEYKNAANLRSEAAYASAMQRYLDSTTSTPEDRARRASEIEDYYQTATHQKRFLKSRLDMLQTDEEKDTLFRDFATGAGLNAVEDKRAIAGHLNSAMRDVKSGLNLKKLAGSEGEGAMLSEYGFSTNPINIATGIVDLLDPAKGYVSDERGSPLTTKKADEYGDYCADLNVLLSDADVLSGIASAGTDAHMPSPYKLSALRDRRKRRLATSTSKWGRIRPT